MNWYLSKIIFQIICGTGNHTPQFDEQLRLILAEDETEALAKAKKIGEDEQESFLNEHNRLVQWHFIDVTELYKLSNMIDGAEIFSRIEEYDHADAYIELVRRRAVQLQQMESRKLLQLI
ncbi:MAG TPA: DUF4288 domain-containing protein [Chitinophagales bacterium]|nr:DUF4288 domain-containing protein [Chitinophagales bacterium]